MALTGRFVIALALGAIPLIAIGRWWVLLAWLALVLALVVVDLAL